MTSGLPHVDVEFWAQWKDEHNKTWGMSCELSEQVSADIVLDRVLDRGYHTSREETINTIKQKLNPDHDMAMTSLRVSLQCPVGQIRMSTPTRTQKCNHLQVTYLTRK